MEDALLPRNLIYVLVVIFNVALCWAKPSAEPVALVAYRPSFKWYSEQLKQGPEISKAFQAGNLDQIDALVLRNQPTYPQLLREFQQSTPFLRGEIEDSAVLNSVITWLQLSILESRKHPSRALLVYEAWFQMAADLAYQESSLIGMKTSAVIRALLLDELERMPGPVQSASDPQQWMIWVQKLNLPWPIDRVILSEGKKFFSEKGVKVSQRVAQSLQKNPYQTAENLLSPKDSLSENERAFLVGMWKKTDVDQMIGEVNRLGRLQIKWAQEIYQKKYGQPALKNQQLVEQKVLFRLPIDYTTGKPM